MTLSPRLSAVVLSLAAVLGLAGPAAAASLQFTLQPYATCESASFDPASCTTPDFEVPYFQSIFAQIGIQVNIAPTATLFDVPFSTTYDDGGEVDGFAFLNDFTNDLGSPPPQANTVYMAWTPNLAGSTIGLAYVDAPAFPYGIVQGPGLSQRGEAVVLAHEIGHVLGGRHEWAEDETQLMYPFYNAALYDDPEFLPGFSAANRGEILASPILAPAVTPTPPATPAPAVVPLPPAAPALAGAMVLLALLRRKRTAAAA
jgi:hypothetical protein